MKRIFTAALVLAALASAGCAYDPLNLALPDGMVGMSLHFVGKESVADSYWDMRFSGIPADRRYSIRNDLIYKGWCADPTRMINPIDYQTRLYSAYETDLPARMETVPATEWDKITYMLNRYRRENAYDSPKCAGTGAGACEIQNAIWYYRGNQTYPHYCEPNKECLDYIKADADAHDGYLPSHGELATVLCDTNEGDLQLILVEIPYMAPEQASATVAVLCALCAGAFAWKRRE
jgi:hypothetical protein